MGACNSFNLESVESGAPHPASNSSNWQDVHDLLSTFPTILAQYVVIFGQWQQEARSVTAGDGPSRPCRVRVAVLETTRPSTRGV